MSVASFEETLKNSVRSVADFPKAGILFRDITPLLLDKDKFALCINRFVELTPLPVDYVISIESRGFIFGSALAYALGAGFVPIRKEGKLPFETFKTSCTLEYGQAVLEIHKDAIHPGSRVLIIDDVLATGGTIEAAVELVRKFKVEIAGLYFLIELKDLKGIRKLAGLPVQSLLSY